MYKYADFMSMDMMRMEMCCVCYAEIYGSPCVVSK